MDRWTKPGQHARGSLRIAFLAAVVTLYGAGNLGVASAQSLESELARAAPESPVVATSMQRAESAWQRARQAYSGHFPSIDYSVDTGRERVDNKATNAAKFTNGVQRNRAKDTLTVSVNLFAGFQIHGSYLQALAAYREAQYRVDESVASFIRDGAGIFTELWAARQLASNAQRVESLRDRLLSLQRSQGASGSGVALDELQSQLRLLQTQEQRIAADTRLSAAVEAFRRHFLADPPTQIDEPNLPIAYLPASRSEAAQMALGNAPSLLARRERLEGAAAARTVARSTYYPRVDLTGTLDGESNVGGVNGQKKTTSVLARASWNLFDGFRTTRGLQAANADYNAADGDSRLAGLDAERRVLDAFDAYLGRSKRGAIAQQSASVAQQIMDTRSSARRAGNATEPEVLESEIAFLRASDLVLSSQAAEINAAFELLAASGQLTPQVLGIEEFFPVRRDPGQTVNPLNAAYEF